MWRRGPGMIPQDVPVEVSTVHATAIAAKYSKGVGTPDCRDTSDMEWITRVMHASGRWDEGQQFGTYALPRSPLCLVGRDADIVYHQLQQGRMTWIVGVPIVGATSPATLAADLALRFAETFGYMTFMRMIMPPPNNQARCGGFNSDPVEMDLRQGHMAFASPRIRLARIAWTQMQGEFYKMPGASGTGIDFGSEAAEPGIQSCIENGLMGIATVTRGVYTDSDGPITGSAGLGPIVTNLAVCFEQAVLDNEIVSYLNKFLEGIQVDEETLAVDVIKEVGPSGEFVSTDHTLRHFRDVSWHSDFFHRGPFDAWVAGGRKGPLEMAKEKVREAMKIEVPLMIPEDRAREVDRVLEEAERALVK
jgi:trimethylamine--corrinoid protein Co-methyltransferase